MREILSETGDSVPIPAIADPGYHPDNPSKKHFFSRNIYIQICFISADLFHVIMLAKLTTLLLLVGLLVAPGLAAAEFSALVTGVHDGDTLTVIRRDETLQVRLSGIDSPEMNQPFGDDARSFTAVLALGRTVTAAATIS